MPPYNKRGAGFPAPLPVPVPIRFITLITLIAFIFTTCAPPVDNRDEPDSNNDTVVPEDPKPVFFYMDENCEAIEEDAGITGFAVLDYTYTKTFMARSEIFDEESIVRMAFNETTDAAVYFNKDSDFPRSILISETGGVVMYITLTNYDSEANTCTTVIKRGAAEISYDAVPITRRTFTEFDADETAGDSQKTRAANIISSIDVLASLYMYYITTENQTRASSKVYTYDDMFDDNYIYAWLPILGIGVVLMLLSLLPGLIGLVFLGAGLSLVTLAAFIKGMETKVKSKLKDMIKDELERRKQMSEAFVYVTIETANHRENIYDLIAEGGMDEYGSVKNLSTLVFPNSDTEHFTWMPTIDIRVNIPGLWDTVYLGEISSEYILNMEMVRDFHFMVYSSGTQGYHFQFRRESDAFTDKGVMPFVFSFGRDVIINDDPSGILYKNPYNLRGVPADNEETLHKNLFVINFINKEHVE